MIICENCGKEHDSSYGSGRFCDNKCARGFSTKGKRKEINEKVSNKLKQFHIDIIRVCENCGCEISPLKRRDTKTCGKVCSAKLRWKNQEYRDNTVKSIRSRCNNINERLRLKEIGRKGGFGKKGYTSNGVYYESNLEKKCFEFLDENEIKYIPHKSIPNTSKCSDIFLNDFDIWIELDGIDREKRKKWLGENYIYWLEKLEIYKKEGLTLRVIKSYSEFVEFILSRDKIY